ncbi:MAG: Hsp20/alpha crystallin family protein [Candidatus Paceibacterota bacterium]|jgi:HSP20 family protein
MAKKPSFFERITGSRNIDDESDAKDLDHNDKSKNGEDEEDTDGQLAVDVYQTPREIIIKTMTAGIRPEDLDIAITRDMVTIKGKREEAHEVSEENYYHKELFWGSFSRTILLPQEVEIEEAEAKEEHGLLILRLPKIDKQRQAKLRVK